MMSLAKWFGCGFLTFVAAGVVAMPGTADAAKSVRAGSRGRPPVLTGAQTIHDLRIMNGRYCFDGHVHYGASMGMPNAQMAQHEAINSWFQLVYIEYGTEWADYNKAAAKKVQCTPSSAGWGCEVRAIPCH